MSDEIGEDAGRCVEVFAKAALLVVSTVTAFVICNEIQNSGKIIIDLPRNTSQYLSHKIIISPDDGTLIDRRSSGFIGGYREIDFKNNSLTKCFWVYQRGVGVNQCEEMSLDDIELGYRQKMKVIYDTFVPLN
jgi:hypothetical protein